MIDFDLARLVPRFLLRDRNARALAMAMGAGLRYFLDRCAGGLDVLFELESMPEWRLDERAWEMNILWYDAAASVDEKRQTIADAIDIRRNIGTPEAILQAVNGVFGSGRVEEWPRYGGEPYHYCVYTSNSDALEARAALFAAMVGVVQSARSVLDAVYYVGAEGTATIWPTTAAVGMSGEASAEAWDYFGVVGPEEGSVERANG